VTGDNTAELVAAVKLARTYAVRDYVVAAGGVGVVCFSSGNASRLLREAGLDVVDVSPLGDLQPRGWISAGLIRRWFPNRFDATCGHLPLAVMASAALILRRLTARPARWETAIPSGSGETLAILRMAFPDRRFYPTTDGTPATERDPNNPLSTILADYHDRPYSVAEWGDLTKSGTDR
jgi:hypothetical protein